MSKREPKEVIYFRSADEQKANEPKILKERLKTVDKMVDLGSAKGLTNMKMSLDNNSVTLQGKNVDGGTACMFQKWIGSGKIISASEFPKPASKQDLKKVCKTLYKSGYKQTVIAKILGISQPYVSTLCTDKSKTCLKSN